MQSFYLLIVILLFFFAVFDLVVGVSNDAVNFLNSAIGSKVAKFKTILIVASIGILIGAFTSAGMMEVARKGIFDPHYFYFNEIMLIFIAVMLTDILLLDVFNTYGLPTSTTVSVVFELLGAAVFVSLYKIFTANEHIGLLAKYINTQKAGEIIIGIFASIIVAFIVGIILQFISRLIFTFQFKKRLPYFGAVYSGIAFTVLSYFLIVKGLKDSFLSDQIHYISEHTGMFFLVMIMVFTAIMFVLNNILKLPVLNYVVLFGTLSLAASFAGNDLVNFIGVPIAGFQSFLAWSNSTVPANEFSMSILAEKVSTPTYLLLGAGVIMTLTLWFNKKARTVTETEVNLGRQSEGQERFEPNFVARSIVKLFRLGGEAAEKIIPQSIAAKINANFANTEDLEQGQAFDVIRASVNLVVASLLITFATNMKLPLSTTFVSFMVAMGSSLSDRAWGRESAAYRIAGVMHVISGWFLTAIIAFTVSGIFAFLLILSPAIMLSLLLFSVAFVLLRNHYYHKKMMHLKSKSEKYAELESYEMPKAIYKFNEQISGLHKELKSGYNLAFNALYLEKSKPIRHAKEIIENIAAEADILEEQLFKIIKKNKNKSTEIGKFFVYSIDHLQELSQSAVSLINSVELHIENSHKPLKPEQIEELKKLQELSNQFLDLLSEKLLLENDVNIDDLLLKKKAILQEVELMIGNQVAGISDKKYGYKNTNTLLSIVLENKDIIAVSFRFIEKTAVVLKKLQ